MRRLNFLDDERPWDEVSDEARVRWFGHPFEADMLGASLWEFRPGSPGGPLHMQWDADRSHPGGRGGAVTRRRRLLPGRPGGLHDFSNPTAEPVRMLAISTKWLSGDEGIIARFELPGNE
jgi:hypothetical protein